MPKHPVPDLAKAHAQEKAVVLGSSTNTPYLSEFGRPAKPAPVMLEARGTRSRFLCIPAAPVLF